MHGEEPVEDIRASVRFVLSIDRAFDADDMPVPEAVHAYMAEFSTYIGMVLTVLPRHKGRATTR